MSRPAGDLIQSLMEHWCQEHPSRASGGWWALSGFAFQASGYLLRFFRGLEEEATEPGELAQMERLSDIICPEDGRIRLVQVKRTLGKRQLVEAVHEAYLIARLCEDETPELTDRLCFQIACRHRATPLFVSDLTADDLAKENLDPRLCDLTLAQFDQQEPILEEPDPLDQLHIYVWNLGLADTAEMVDQCLGVLLRYFDAVGPEAPRHVGRELNSVFRQADRREAGWPAETWRYRQH